MATLIIYMTLEYKIVFGDAVGLTVGEAFGVCTVWLLVGVAFKLLEGLAVGDSVGSYEELTVVHPAKTNLTPQRTRN